MEGRGVVGNVGEFILSPNIAVAWNVHADEVIGVFGDVVETVIVTDQVLGLGRGSIVESGAGQLAGRRMGACGEISNGRAAGACCLLDIIDPAAVREEGDGGRREEAIRTANDAVAVGRVELIELLIPAADGEVVAIRGDACAD